MGFPSFVMSQVVADVATSTATTTDTVVVEEVATSTPALDLGAASSTTTTTAEVATTSAEVAADKPQATTTPESAEELAERAAAKGVIDDITADQEKYFAEHGEYLPILPNGKLLPGKAGSVAEKLGRDIPADAFVEVYDGPRGKGYRVAYTHGNKYYSVGYGPDAAAFTYSYDLPTDKTDPGVVKSAASPVNHANSRKGRADAPASPVDSTIPTTTPDVPTTPTTPEASTTPITLPDASPALPGRGNRSGDTDL